MTDPNQLLDYPLDELVANTHWEIFDLESRQYLKDRKAAKKAILEHFISKDEVVTAIGEPTHPYCDALNCQQLTSHRKEEGADQLRNELRKKLGL